jgi:hypothetical protein
MAMREFPSCHDFRSFSTSVKRHSRYILEPHAEEFLQAVTETAASRIDTLEAGSILFRSQIGHDWKRQPLNPNEPDGDFCEEPIGFAPERMKPLKDSAREGRVNPKGIPCLYLADDPDTAMSETRPWIGSQISLAEFKILEDLPILNCPEPKLRTGPIFLTPPHFREPEDPKERENAVWGEIAYAFSEPVTLSDTTADYAPTQILAEAFRKIGCAGIRYKSRLGKGFSFALFSPESADLINCGVFSTEGVTFTFRQAANPYFIPKHYPELSP